MSCGVGTSRAFTETCAHGHISDSNQAAGRDMPALLVCCKVGTLLTFTIDHPMSKVPDKLGYVSEGA